MKHEYDVERRTIPAPPAWKYIPGAPLNSGYETIVYRDVSKEIAKKEHLYPFWAQLWSIRVVLVDRFKMWWSGK